MIGMIVVGRRCVDREDGNKPVRVGRRVDYLFEGMC